MKMNALSGGALAAAAVALAVAGGVAPAAANKVHATVRCVGINACKGHSACKGADNSCKGLNACKGQGWLQEKSKAACEAKGGSVG
jgi:hypothetical protein